MLTNASQPQYVLDSQISVNRAQITQVRTILASENQVKKRFDISIGNEFTPFSLQASHQTIGNNSQEKMPATENNYNLNTLFLSSPLLMCQQGKRTFTLDHFNVSSLQDYDIFISTKEGWLYIGDSEDVKTNDEPSYVLDSSILTIILPPTVPALIPPGESLESIHPVIQMVPRRGAPALELDYVELSVEVNGITDINFTNDDGNFKNDGDFNVFGAEPSVGASLYFRCSDIANMPITNLSLNMNWVPGALPNLELSEGGSGVPNIDGIYKNYYIPNKPDAGEGSDSLIHPGDQYIDEFIIDLQNANGIEIQLGSAQTVSKKLFQKTIKWSDIKHQDTNFETLKISLSKGDFLYSQYFVSQNIQAQKLAKDNVNKILAAIGAAPEPNDDGSPSVNKVIYPPYTPATRPISLDYNTGPDKVNLQYINEFGQLQDSAESLDGYQSNANENGILFKISPILKDQSVSVLLAIKNQNNPSDLQSIDASQLKVRWHYYLPKKKGDSGEVPEVESGWQAFIPKTQWNKQYDYCLLTLNKPEELSEDEIWIKASISNGLLLSNTNLIYLYTQVVLASEVIDENHYFPVPLAKNNIRSFVQSNNKISTIRQPLASFGGSTKQSEWQLSKAASNRLKNRDRAITPSDYESLVLNQFPQVERVVCDRACQDSAGIVSILITPKKITYNEKGFSLAGSQLLISIKKFLESRSSQAVSLTVGFDGNDQ